VERRRRNLGGVELIREVEREQDLREPGLRLGPDAVVAVLEHHVAEVDRHVVAGGGDLDDPRGAERPSSGSRRRISV
jgi:hypothetical protein